MNKIIILLAMLFICSFSVSAISQDDYCELINGSMTVSQCNDVWDLATSQVIINNTETVIQNNSITLTESEIKDLIEDEIEDYIDDYMEDNFENQLSTLQSNNQKEIELARINANKTVPVVENCDAICELQKMMSLFQMMNTFNQPQGDEDEKDESDKDSEIARLQSKLASRSEEKNQSSSLPAGMGSNSLVIILLVVGILAYSQRGKIKETLQPTQPIYSQQPVAPVQPIPQQSKTEGLTKADDFGNII
jgi:hypothetical protein